MESSWRLNVPMLGWSDFGIELYAHDPIDFVKWTAKYTALGDVRYLRASSADGGQTWFSVLMGFPTAAHPHFPYGFPAEPD